MKLIGEVASLRADLACLVVIFRLYFLLQTRWGVPDHVSNWISGSSGYHLTFDVMDHRFPPHPIFYWRM